MNDKSVALFVEFRVCIFASLRHAGIRTVTLTRHVLDYWLVCSAINRALHNNIMQMSPGWCKSEASRATVQTSPDRWNSRARTKQAAPVCLDRTDLERDSFYRHDGQHVTVCSPFR